MSEYEKTVAALAALTHEQVDTARMWFESELHDDARADTMGEDHRQSPTADLSADVQAHVRLVEQAETSGEPDVWEAVEKARRGAV